MTQMEALPIEILHQVISCLPQNNLAGYASVSKDWNAIIEGQTFASIRLTPSDLLRFRQILDFSATSPHLQRRRAQVKSVLFKAVLAEYNVAARSKYETQEDQAKNNKAYYQAIKSLFETLALWPESEGCEILLEIAAQSPSDLQAETDRKKMMQRIFTLHTLDNRKDLCNGRFAHSLLNIDEEKESLCLVPVVGGIDIWSAGRYRKVTPSAQSKIISRLPRLQSIQIDPDDNERKSEMLRNNLRKEFALSLAEWPKSLKSLCLEYTGNPPENQNISPPIRSVAGKDPLSLALNALSQQLECIWLLSISIGPEIFWPPTQKTQPYWPRLSYLHLRYTAATPSGQWLFEKDPRWRERSPIEFGYDTSSSWEDEDVGDMALQDYRPDFFRSKPLDIINDIYIAAGNAARQMPQIKTMDLEASIPEIDGVEDVLGCCPSHEFTYDRPSGTATWISSSEFHVTGKMREVWDAAAKSHRHAQVTIENFKNYDHLEGWDD